MGIEPEKLFLFNSNSMIKVRLKKQDGITPLKLLFDRSRKVRLVALQIEGWIFPLNLLFEAVNCLIDDGRIGKGSLNKLESRKRFPKFGKVRRISMPEDKELCERLR